MPAGDRQRQSRVQPRPSKAAVQLGSRSTALLKACSDRRQLLPSRRRHQTAGHAAAASRTVFHRRPDKGTPTCGTPNHITVQYSRPATDIHLRFKPNKNSPIIVSLSAHRTKRLVTIRQTLVCVLSYITSAVILSMWLFGDRYLGESKNMLHF